MIDTRAFTVGPVQENAYIVRADAQATRALLVDPGEEPQRLLDAAEALAVEIEAILITHCHFDHVGAVAPIARATGAPVYCPEIEFGVLADITKWTMPGFGPFESWQAEHTVKGGERLQLAGIDVEVLFTPGHSPGHVTYAIAPANASTEHPPAAEPSTSHSTVAELSIGHSTVAEPSTGSSTETQDEEGSTGEGSTSSLPALLSGDVLFQGSVGRVDLPGGDWATLERSIGMLMDRFERDTVVYPGHMGVTTLGREWDANPFLAELRSTTMTPVPARMGVQERQ